MDTGNKSKPVLEDLPVTGIAKEIDNFLAAFGGVWPPRPSFEWPACLQTYHQIWEEATFKIHEINKPERFREWLRKKFNDKVVLEEVLKELETRMTLSDPVLLGLQGCLQILALLYRWGALPTNDEERARTQLTFPEQLWTPFTMISELYGTVPASCMFNIAFACNEYDSNGDKPLGRHFWWNWDPKIRASEDNFFLTFVRVDNAFQLCLKSIREFLLLTDAGRNDRGLAKKLFPRRVEIIKELKQQFLDIHKIYTDQVVTRGKVDKEVFADYIQNMAGWGLDGNGGGSGAEILTFAMLDEFLDLSGNSISYIKAYEKRNNMTRLARDLLRKIGTDHKEDRFDSFLGLTVEEDPLIQAKDDVIKTIYIWRLGHAKSSHRYTEKTKMTAAGKVETTLQSNETIQSQTLALGQARARETAEKITNKMPSVSIKE